MLVIAQFGVKCLDIWLPSFTRVDDTPCVISGKMG